MSKVLESSPRVCITALEQHNVLQVDVCIPESRKGPARQLAAALAGTVTGAAANAAVRAPIQAGRSGACSISQGIGDSGRLAYQTVDVDGRRCSLAPMIDGIRHLLLPMRPAPQQCNQSSFPIHNMILDTRYCAAGAVGSKYDPCVDDEVTAYLNRADVQKALHVPLPHRPHVKYAICSNEVQYSRCECATSTLICAVEQQVPVAAAQAHLADCSLLECTLMKAVTRCCSAEP